MIEVTLYEYLSSKLEVPVYTQRPKTLPDEYVVFERTAGGKDNHIPRCTIAIQSYSNSMLGAIELNEKVKEVMENIIELSDISHCSLNSDYNFTDPNTKQYRYQAVFDLVHY